MLGAPVFRRGDCRFAIITHLPQKAVDFRHSEMKKGGNLGGNPLIFFS